MKKFLIAFLLIVTALLTFASCNSSNIQYHNLPGRGSYIAYVREEGNSRWYSWDYESKTVKNALSDKKYDVYFFEISRSFPSLDALKSATDLKEGETVGILSYYEGEGVGASLYEISAEKTSYSSIKTSSSDLLANLVPFTVGEEKIITVDMFGTSKSSKGDQASITKALNFGENITVEFEREKYLQRNTFNLYTSNVFVNGKGATVENLYEGSTVNVDFSIKGDSPENPIKNITVKGLNLTCTEQTGTGALFTSGDHMQIKITNAHFVTIDGCKLIVPEEGDEPRNVDSIWANGGISDIIIENCYVFNYCDSGLGAGIWLSASDAPYGCKNAIIRNNYVEKNSCDEVFALFFGDFDNVLIENNQFITRNHPYPDMLSNNGIGIGVWDIETHCKNIKFIGNEVRLSLQGTAFIFSDSDNVEIANNKIYITTNFGDQEDINDETIIEKAIFRLPEPDKSYKVTNTKVHDNYIEVNCGDYKKYGYNLNTITEAFHEGSEFYNNEFVLNCVIKQWTSNDKSVYHDNKFTINGGILNPDILPHPDFYEKNEVIINGSKVITVEKNQFP